MRVFMGHALLADISQAENKSDRVTAAHVVENLLAGSAPVF